MKKFKQILVIVGLGSIASLAQADCSDHKSLETCLPPCMWSHDESGGVDGCVPNQGTSHKKSTTSKETTPSKEAITSGAKTNKHNKKGLKDVKRS